jgi:hypothetical protein
VLGAVAKAGTDVSALMHRSLRAVGGNDDTEVTAFTDGGPGLRSILVGAGIAEPPILDWFHIAMRLQHAAQSAGALSTDEPAALGQAGRIDEARAALAKAIAIAPASFDLYVRNRAPWHRPEDHAHTLDGLRKAGWQG